MEKWKKTLFVMTAAFCLAGCGSESAPEMDTISIRQDGKIAHTIVEPFDTNYYNPEELETMAKEKIERYNDGGEAIVCESVEASGEQIIVKMIYPGGEDYTNYNNRELFSGTVEEAFAQGYSLKDVVGTDGNVISDEELSAIREKNVVIIQVKDGEKMDVNVYENILYTSDNVTLSGKKDAVIVTQEKEDVLSYIVF